MLQASLIEGFSQGKADPKNLPARINPENVRSVREYKAELEAMQKAMAGKKSPDQRRAVCRASASISPKPSDCSSCSSPG